MAAGWKNKKEKSENPLASRLFSVEGGAKIDILRFRFINRRTTPRRKCGFAALSIEMPKGGGRLRRPEPKTKGNCESSCLLFWKGRLKSIFLKRDKSAAQRRIQIATQRNRLRFGKEEQRRERALT